MVKLLKSNRRAANSHLEKLEHNTKGVTLLTIKFIHTADLHLGSTFNNASFPRGIAKRRREDMWDTFFDIVELAKRERVNFLLISGDLFEDRLITIGQVKRINEAFKSIPEINVVISPGNHDYYWDKSPYKKIEWNCNVTLFETRELTKVSFPQLQTNVYGFAWTTKYIEEPFTFNADELDESQKNILLLHGDVYNKSSQYLPIDKDYLARLPFQYMALGHIHKGEEIQNNMRYPGSPEPLNFGEVGSRGVLLGEMDEDFLHVEFIPLAKRKFIVEEVELSPEMNYEEIVHKLCSFQDKQNLYRLHLRGFRDCDINIDQLIEEASSKFYYLEVNDSSKPDYDLGKIYLENKDNIIGMFIEEMKKLDLEEQKNKDALYLGLEALLKESKPCI